MPKIVKLTDRIQYLQMSNDPLSADVIAVRGDRAWWIFDVGACDEAAQFINALPRIPVEEAARMGRILRHVTMLRVLRKMSSFRISIVTTC